MLMRFTVSNFKSFEDEQEFCMYPGMVERFNDRIVHTKDLKIMKFCALYGANAAGKSNLIHAIDFGSRVITGGIKNADTTEQYCKLRKSNIDKESKFEYEIKVGDKFFAYGFTANLYKQKLLTEWLYELKNKDALPIYEIDLVSGECYYDIDYVPDSMNNKFEVWIDDAKKMSETLFLYEIIRKNTKEDLPLFYEIYNWFDDKLTVIYPETVLGDSIRLFKNSNDKLIRLLMYFDTGITSYEMKPIKEDAFLEYIGDERFLKEIKKVLEDKRGFVRKTGILITKKNLFEINVDRKYEISIQKLLFRHGLSDELFEYGEESDGTKRLIELLNVITGDENDKVYLIDELDRSFHAQMTRKFVETFFASTDKKHSQLIITTHESNLLDLNFLRRDEIWFAEREKNYSTKLYSLENFKVRYDKKIEKDYLDGRYGAVPVFKDFQTYVLKDN